MHDSFCDKVLGTLVRARRSRTVDADSTFFAASLYQDLQKVLDCKLLHPNHAIDERPHPNGVECSIRAQYKKVMKPLERLFERLAQIEQRERSYESLLQTELSESVASHRRDVPAPASASSSTSGAAGAEAAAGAGSGSRSAAPVAWAKASFQRVSLVPQWWNGWLKEYESAIVVEDDTITLQPRAAVGAIVAAAAAEHQAIAAAAAAEHQA